MIIRKNSNGSVKKVRRKLPLRNLNYRCSPLGEPKKRVTM